MEILINIAKLIGASLGVYVTYIGVKAGRIKIQESKRSRPCIANIRGFDTMVWLIITNNKSHPITIQNIEAKEKLFGPIYIKPASLEWSPATNYEPDYSNSITDVFKRFNAIPQYAFTTQQSVSIKFIKHTPGASYKIVVTTTGGQCQSIYHAPLKRPNG